MMAILKGYFHSFRLQKVRVTMKGMYNACHYRLGEKTVWAEDEYNEMYPKKKRMESLVDMLKTTQQHDSDEVGLVGEKVYGLFESCE
jgi:hypothetical protein